jgi:hypothetical protein
LQHFFKILGPIFEEERRICQIKETGPTEIITPTWLEEFVEKFQEPLSAAKKAGVFCDPWEVASLCRDEVRNTKVLAWLLDCRGSHGMGSLVLKTMLSLLKKNMPQELRGVSLEDVRDFNVCLESYPDGLGNNRVDIEIESKDFYVIAEIKIDALERSGQINDYCRIAKEKSCNRPWSVFFITPDGRSAGFLDEEFKEHVVRIPWCAVAQSITSSIRNSRKEIAPFSYFLADKFAAHIRKFYQGGWKCLNHEKQGQ